MRPSNLPISTAECPHFMTVDVAVALNPHKDVQLTRPSPRDHGKATAPSPFWNQNNNKAKQLLPASFLSSSTTHSRPTTKQRSSSNDPQSIVSLPHSSLLLRSNSLRYTTTLLPLAIDRSIFARHGRQSWERPHGMESSKCPSIFQF